MISVTIAEAKSRLAELIDQVNTGEEVVIMRRNHPIARIVPGTAKSPLTVHSLSTKPSQHSDTILGGLDGFADTERL